jgi:hypothetical protein
MHSFLIPLTILSLLTVDQSPMNTYPLSGEILKTKVVAINTPNKALRSAIAALSPRNEYVNERFSFSEIDLNADAEKETIVIMHSGINCSNRHCTNYIFKNTAKGYKLISEFSSSRETAVFISKNRTNGYLDIVTSMFDYVPRGINQKAWKFNGTKYEMIDVNVQSPPRKAIYSEKSPVFNLR